MNQQGRTYTSNTAKLLKNMAKLQLIQDGKRPSPVMFHMSPINACNLTCSFCCFANRAMKEMLTLEQMKKAVDSFWELGTRAMELTGGGSPSLHPDFHKIIEYAYNKGFKIGVCTNGTTLTKWKDTWGMCAWVRLGMYGFDEGYTYDLSVFEGTNTEISAAYVWDANLGTSKNPNVTGDWSDLKSKRLSKNFQKKENFFKMLDWVEENKIPTRIAFNAIKPASDIAEDLSCLRGQLKEWEEKSGKILQHAFLSDFNYKPDRRNNNCYMGMVKPFVFTNGFVYPCPSMELSPENSYMVNDEFKLCDIDGIVDYYNKGVDKRSHPCSWCKYSAQNELIDDILMETKHNDFA